MRPWLGLLSAMILGLVAVAQGQGPPNPPLGPTLRVVAQQAAPPIAQPSQVQAPPSAIPPVAMPPAAVPGAEMLPPALQAIAPLTLGQCSGLALANHPNLIVAQANVEQAYGQVVQAGLYPNPRLDNGNPQFILGGLNSVYNVGLTQTVVRGGKLRLSQSAAREALRQAELDIITTRFNVLTDVRNQFVIVLATQERIATLERLVTILQHSETISSDLLRAGRVSESDLLLTRIERRRAESNLRSEQQQIIGYRRQLATLLGIANYPIGQVTGDLKARVPLLDDAPLAPEMVDNNSQVRRAEVDINRVRFLLGRARADSIPDLIAQGGYQYLIGDNPSQATIGLYMDVPIFNRNQGNIRAANAQIRESSAQLGVTRLDLFRQLADAESDYRAAANVVRNYEEGLIPDATRALELIQRGYEQGLFDILRVLQAQRSLFEANLDYIQAQQTRLTAAAKLAGLLQLDTFP
ncbi:MAG: TolC family protein [Planctomycetes bacterium]|nr:TolC family protein [Planctomycetota bacterium]